MTNIFIIDDSVLFRTKMSKDIESQPNLKVIGTANDVMIAKKRFNMLDEFPQIVILDVEMPEIDGLTFLEDVLSRIDTKVIVCTSCIDKYKRKALSLGAVDVIDKKEINQKNSSVLVESINKHKKLIKKSINKTTKIMKSINKNFSDKKLVVIGASTGGLEILEYIFKSLPSKTPPILVVQHMGRDIMSTFIPKLKKLCKVDIKEAMNDEIVEQNRVYIAPFGKHLSIKENKTKYKIVITDEVRVSFHKPSIDVLFNSVAKIRSRNVSAFILTGMGSDGVEGIKNIKTSGGKTYAQDEQSCTVFGMSKVAIESKMIDEIIKPEDIVSQILSN